MTLREALALINCHSGLLRSTYMEPRMLRSPGDHAIMSNSFRHSIQHTDWGGRCGIVRPWIYQAEPVRHNQSVIVFIVNVGYHS
jgi:hypothetical protein